MDGVRRESEPLVASEYARQARWGEGRTLRHADAARQHSPHSTRHGRSCYQGASRREGEAVGVRGGWWWWFRFGR